MAFSSSDKETLKELEPYWIGPSNPSLSANVRCFGFSFFDSLNSYHADPPDLALISKFAQLEYQWGSADRGRTIFENVLTTYPKRVDIWSIYIDMELKTNEVERIRAIFERVITLNLSSKKMKFFFKRYLAFEKEKGNAVTADAVKNKARQWVEMKTSV